MAQISWIKLSTGLPDNKKIKRIRKLPDGDNVILFWVFLLARAGESNKSGGVFLTDTLPYTEEDLAADFDFSVEFVRFAVLTLEKYSMITKYDEVLFIKNWEEYQAIDGLERVREQTRMRVSKHREKQKAIAAGEINDPECNVTGNAEVTPGNGTDIDKELDKEKDIYIAHFEEFWKQYPKKVGKKKAKEQFLKKIKTDNSLAEFTHGFQAYLNYINQTSWYSPKDLFRWIRDEGYKDDYDNSGVGSSISDEIADTQRRLDEVYGQQ